MSHDGAAGLSLLPKVGRWTLKMLPFFYWDITRSEMDNDINAKLAKLVDLKEAEKRQIFRLPPPLKCDLCSKNLSKEKYYIDGMTNDKELWANMCAECFNEHGVEIAWGKGQLYMQVKKGSWLMVAGFSPQETEEDAVCFLCGEQVSKSDMIKAGEDEWACPGCIEEAASIHKKVIGEREKNKNIQEKTVAKPNIRELQELARRKRKDMREKRHEVLLNDQNVKLLNREEAEKIAGKILDQLKPENYPKILALNRESAIRGIVDSAHVGNNQYREGFLTNAVLTIESDLSH